MNVTWNNNFAKSRCFSGLCEIQIFKITYVSYLGKVFKRLTNKIQSSKFKNLQFLQVFVMSYSANLERWKRRKIWKNSFQWQINKWGAIFMGLN